MKRIFTIAFVCIFFMIITGWFVLLITSALKWAISVINQAAPTPFEWVGIIFVCLIGGATGAAWFAIDTAE